MRRIPGRRRARANRGRRIPFLLLSQFGGGSAGPGGEEKLVQTRTTIWWCAATMLFVCGCGNSTRYANKPRPALPVNLTVAISDSRVSVSPSTVGAGPVVFEVTNQSTRAESLSVARTGGGGSLASTGPINPQGTAQVSVNFARGDYMVSTSTAASGNDASQAQSTSVRPARVHVGPSRPGSRGVLLTP
jgi:hypothetical protein